MIKIEADIIFKMKPKESSLEKKKRNIPAPNSHGIGVRKKK